MIEDDISQICFLGLLFQLFCWHNLCLRTLEHPAWEEITLTFGIQTIRKL